MTLARDPLFLFESAPSDEEVAVLTAILLARVASPPPPSADRPRPRWQHGYRSPGSWR